MEIESLITIIIELSINIVAIVGGFLTTRYFSNQERLGSYRIENERLDEEVNFYNNRIKDCDKVIQSIELYRYIRPITNREDLLLAQDFNDFKEVRAERKISKENLQWLEELWEDYEKLISNYNLRTDYNLLKEQIDRSWNIKAHPEESENAFEEFEQINQKIDEITCILNDNLIKFKEKVKELELDDHIKKYIYRELIKELKEFIETKSEYKDSKPKFIDEENLKKEDKDLRKVIIEQKERKKELKDKKEFVEFEIKENDKLIKNLKDLVRVKLSFFLFGCLVLLDALIPLVVLGLYKTPYFWGIWIRSIPIEWFLWFFIFTFVVVLAAIIISIYLDMKRDTKINKQKKAKKINK